MAIDWKSFYANGGWRGLEPPSFYEQGDEEIVCEVCEGEGCLIEEEREVVCPECNGAGYIKLKNDNN